MIRLLRWVAIVAVLGYLAYLASVAPSWVHTLVAALCYVAAGYVFWRALPAIRSDARVVLARLPRRSGRYRGGDL